MWSGLRKPHNCQQAAFCALTRTRPTDSRPATELPHVRASMSQITCRLVRYTCHLASYTCHRVSYTSRIVSYTCQLVICMCNIFSYTCHSARYTCDIQQYVSRIQLYVSPSQPYVSSSQPYVSSSQPHLSSSKPHVSACQPHVSACQPYVSACQLLVKICAHVYRSRVESTQVLTSPPELTLVQNRYEAHAEPLCFLPPTSGIPAHVPTIHIQKSGSCPIYPHPAVRHVSVCLRSQHRAIRFMP